MEAEIIDALRKQEVEVEIDIIDLGVDLLHQDGLTIDGMEEEIDMTDRVHDHDHDHDHEVH